MTRIQAAKEALCPPTRPRFRCARTQSRRQRQDPIVTNDQASKTLRPKPSSIVSASAGGHNSQLPRAIADVWEPPGVFTRRLPPHHSPLTHPHKEHVAMSKTGHVDRARITKASSRSISPMAVVNRTRTRPVAAASPVVSARSLKALDAPDERAP